MKPFDVGETARETVFLGTCRKFALENEEEILPVVGYSQKSSVYKKKTKRDGTVVIITPCIPFLY